MNCRNCQPLLSEYIDGGIHGNDRAAVEAHVRVCSACHGVNTQDQLGQAAPTQSPEALRVLLRAWKAEQTPGRRRSVRK